MRAKGEGETTYLAGDVVAGGRPNHPVQVARLSALHP